MIPALITIDIQKGFLDPVWGLRNNPFFDENVSLLLRRQRSSGGDIFHIRHISTDPHSPLRPHQSGVEFQDLLSPREDEMILSKQVNSAFIGTELERELKKRGHSDVILIGLTTDHCVSTTARMAANLGFKVLIASDATATFARISFEQNYFSADLIHKTALASLHGEFARVLTTDSIRKIQEC